MSITVIFHQEPEGWWAECPDAPSFFATGESREVVRQRVHEHLPRLMASADLDYVEVEVAASAVALLSGSDEFNAQSWFGTGGVAPRTAPVTC